MIKILHILPGADAGGISTVVLNYFSKIDRNSFSFDICLTTNIEGINAEKLKQLGANIFHIPLKSKSLKMYKKSLQKILKSNNYDVIHVHENLTSFVALRVAKKCGIKIRIAHSHTTAPTNSLFEDFKRRICMLLNRIYATKLIGCGKMAAKRVFGKSNKVIILPNSINSKRFSYDENIRNKKRAELNIQNKFVIGTVGRLSKQKNQMFLLKIAKQLTSIDNSVVFLIVGNGNLFPQLDSYIRDNDLSENVKLIGKSDNVPELLQIFDVFVMPSLYEGFPVAAVEALASGLKVLLSNTITSELSIFDYVTYLPIKHDEDILLWVNQISSIKNNKYPREQRDLIVSKNGFNIENTVKQLERIYMGE